MNSVNNPSIQPLYKEYNPWMLLLSTLGVTMVGFQFIGAFFGLLIAFFFYPGDMQMYSETVFNPLADEAMRTPLLIMQGVGSTLGFIVFPWLLVKFFYKGSFQELNFKGTTPLLVLIAMLITFSFMGVNAIFIEWNQNFIFPEALSGLEEKLRDLENSIALTSAYLTHFESFGQLILGLVVVAVIPGIGEELVFRGLVQNHVYRISGNIHIAIWTGALLFSLFHVQFYGLVPRMFLGVMFGYMYYFSGNIIYPMVAHFFNNGFTLVMLYLFQLNIVDYNIESTDILPWSQVLLAAGITLALFISFKRNANLRPSNE